MAAEELPAPKQRVEDSPPPLGTWGRLYLVVLGTLAMEILLLALLARAFG